MKIFSKFIFPLILTACGIFFVVSFISKQKTENLIFKYEDSFWVKKQRENYTKISLYDKLGNKYTGFIIKGFRIDALLENKRIVEDDFTPEKVARKELENRLLLKNKKKQEALKSPTAESKNPTLLANAKPTLPNLTEKTNPALTGASNTDKDILIKNPNDANQYSHLIKNPAESTGKDPENIKAVLYLPSNKGVNHTLVESILTSFDIILIPNYFKPTSLNGTATLSHQEQAINVTQSAISHLKGLGIKNRNITIVGNEIGAFVALYFHQFYNFKKIYLLDPILSSLEQCKNNFGASLCLLVKNEFNLFSINIEKYIKFSETELFVTFNSTKLSQPNVQKIILSTLPGIEIIKGGPRGITNSILGNSQDLIKIPIRSMNDNFLKDANLLGDKEIKLIN